MSAPPSWSPEPPDDRRIVPRVPSPYDTPAFGTAPSAGASSAGASSAGQPYGGRPPYGAAPRSSDAYGANPYGPGPSSANPYNTPAYGADPGPSPYGYGYAYGPGATYAAQRTSGLAIASLVTSLAAFLLPITAPVGLILGIVALRGISRDQTQGRGLAIAGIAVGAIMSLALVAGIILFVGLLAAIPTSGGFAT
jgi:hypothetical protein